MFDHPGLLWILAFIIAYVVLFAVVYGSGTIVEKFMLWLQARSHRKWQREHERLHRKYGG